MQRVFHMWSTYSKFHDEVVRMKGILKENCFPVPFVDHVIKNVLNQHFSKRPQPTREEKLFLVYES